ncbi:sulfurtransferase complex subunit TusB [Motiliproteus sp.]|uniref:sulfurtransferase complex subunit TusB n=1 Tax=Motiliproteus sp. TaxID=1898955 RepID=UPI003BA9305B
MVLHTVNSSPTQTRCLQDCLRLISPPAMLLLIEDGVYGATQAHQSLLEQLPDGISCAVLQPDVEARGLGPVLSDRFELIDDAGFVALTIKCDRVQSWY